SLLPVLSRDNLVILESTVAPRTTEDVLVPILERSGLKVGDGLHVAYCPERVLPGRTLRELVENDRIIGGVDSRSAELAMQLYSQVVDGPIVATDATSAELSKLMENASRDVNIALANELARVCTHFGRDARSVFALSNRHPRVKLLDAGPGVGGHCIPVDPWFLIQALPQDCRLLRTAREINDQQPARVMQRVKEIVGWPPGPKVTILGLAYKADVDDVRNSPAVQLARMLAGEGYELGICDPHVRSIDLRLTPPTPALEGTDCVLVLTGHSEFLLLDPLQVRQVVRTANLLDTRGALDSKQWAAAGFAVHTL
ncbi:MAG: nucleotide sugar dehydrogenase, partial [Candidatus Wallbacteria bacterium]|nr:nucleotide sugar dehydrogenase [Candidatus Wallbacteria bacterium]